MDGSIHELLSALAWLAIGLTFLYWPVCLLLVLIGRLSIRR
jgi:hypothetical protein